MMLSAVYRGVVTGHDDAVEGRLRVVVAQLASEPVLAFPVFPVDPPPIGSGVFVMFEGGDPSYPVWMGNFGVERGH